MKRTIGWMLMLAVLVALPAPMALGAEAASGAYSAKAGTAGVTKGLFVKLSSSGTLPVVVTATAVDDKTIGVCEQTAAEDAMTRYAPVGTRTLVTSGELIAVGDLVTAGAGGKAFVLDADDASTQRIAAVALTAASGADEDVTVIVVAGTVEQQALPDAADESGTKVVTGVPFRIVFEPTIGETLTYTVPTGVNLRVLNAYGWKTEAAGDAAEDQWDLKNNDGTAANIFDTEELNAIADKTLCPFDNLDDAEAEVAAGDTLDLVAGEDADDDGADGFIIVECLFVAP